jgi:CRISPR/Cas system endoribonuclease Cas6 (RAMP superfamily)
VKIPLYVMENKLFRIEKKILDNLTDQEGIIYSEIRVSNNPLTIDELTKRDKFKPVYYDSIMHDDKIIHAEAIFLNTSNFYLYLSREDYNINSYEMKIYYKASDLNEVNFFIMGLKRLKQK